MVSRRGIQFGESVPLNWQRGMFRLWLLVSAAWIMGWAIYLILSVIAQALTSLEDFLAIPIVFFGPPIALLLCGLAACGPFVDSSLSSGNRRPPPSAPKIQWSEDCGRNFLTIT